MMGYNILYFEWREYNACMCNGLPSSSPIRVPEFHDLHNIYILAVCDFDVYV
jgi:hypothetical protein